MNTNASASPNPNPDAERANRIKDLASRAIALPKSDRQAFIVHACAGDALLAIELHDLLAAHEAAGSFLAAPTHTAANRSSSSPTSSTPDPIHEAVGTKIGQYKLLELIGEGGFGSVFMAEQREPVQRKVALKVIKPGMDSKLVSARFEAERQALALMDHPHIARVFDGGVTDANLGSRPYFVMEYVRGETIITFANAHKLNLKDRLALFTQVCQAVQHAHTKGIIHRDLKPGNILVSMTDGRPFAKVIDFGIAKATGARLTDKTLFTEHRQLIGTPEYMSPEQAEGSPDIDTRTDVYALGVLLYELLTNATPFDAKRLRSAAFAEMQRIIKEEDPPKPSLKVTALLHRLPPTQPSGAGFQPASTVSTSSSSSSPFPSHKAPFFSPRDLQGELDWIVMKALDKDRARRYESPNQLAADVQRHLSGEAVVAAPPTMGYRVRKFVKRNKGKVIAGSAVAAALLVGIAGTSVGMIIANRANLQLASQVNVAKKAFGRIVANVNVEGTDNTPFSYSIQDGDHATELFVDADGRLSYLHRRIPYDKNAVDVIHVPESEMVVRLADMAEHIATQAIEARAKLETANVQLLALNTASLDSLKRLAQQLGEDIMASGHSIPEDRILTAIGHSGLWAAIRVDALGKPEIAFLRNGATQEVAPADVSQQELKIALDSLIGVALDELIKSRVTMEETNATLREQSEIAKKALSRVVLGYMGPQDSSSSTNYIQDAKTGEMYGITIKDGATQDAMTIVPAGPEYEHNFDKGVMLMLSEWAGSSAEKAYKLNAQLREQVAVANQAMQLICLEGTKGLQALDAGLPLYPDIRGEPGFKLAPTLVDDPDMPGGNGYRFMKQEVAKGRIMPLDESKLLPALADMSVAIVKHALGTHEALRAETKRSRLATADLIMQRQLQPSEEKSFKWPSVAELQTAFEARKEYLGMDDSGTIETEFEIAKVLLADDQADGLAILKSAIAHKEHASPTPDGMLIEMWLWAAGEYGERLDFENAEDTNRKLAASLVEAYDKGTLSESRMEPHYWQRLTVGFQTSLGSGDGRAHIEALASRYSNDNGDRLRDRIRVGLPERAWMLASCDKCSKAEYQRAKSNANRALMIGASGALPTRALALAHYRLTNYPDALATVTRAADLRTQAGQGPHPADLAILAMTHFKLGHGEEARAALERLRELMQEKAWAEDADAKALFKEAVELIEGVKSEGKPEGKPEEKAEKE